MYRIENFSQTFSFYTPSVYSVIKKERKLHEFVASIDLKQKNLVVIIADIAYEENRTCLAYGGDIEFHNILFYLLNSRNKENNYLKIGCQLLVDEIVTAVELFL